MIVVGFALVVVLVGGFVAGLLVGLGMTLGILRSVRDRLPPQEGIARAMLDQQIARFRR